MPSDERFPVLQKYTPVMFHSLDRDSRLTDVSDHWLSALGRQRSEVIGRNCTDFFTAASRRYAEEIVLPDYLETGFCTDIPYQIVAKNGTVLDVLCSATAERNDAGEPVRSLCVWTDVTERNRTRQALRDAEEAERKRAAEQIEVLHTDLAARAYELEIANEELEAFSYTVSHDLRKPLTAVGGYCQVLLDLCGGRLDAESAHFIQQIWDGTLRMNQLIGTLLEFSRVSHSKMHREAVDLTRLAAQVAAELVQSEPQRRVFFQIAPGLTDQGDPELLRVVLDNLIGNAWKYSAQQTDACIEFGRLETEGKRSYFVRDNGVGFEAASADGLFTPFQRLPGAKHYQGFGVGLATVKRIIKSHGGRVWAKGEAGQGAVFYFTLG